MCMCVFVCLCVSQHCRPGLCNSKPSVLLHHWGTDFPSAPLQLRPALPWLAMQTYSKAAAVRIQERPSVLNKNAVGLCRAPSLSPGFLCASLAPPPGFWEITLQAQTHLRMSTHLGEGKLTECRASWGSDE